MIIPLLENQSRGPHMHGSDSMDNRLCAGFSGSIHTNTTATRTFCWEGHLMMISSPATGDCPGGLPLNRYLHEKSGYRIPEERMSQQSLIGEDGAKRDERISPEHGCPLPQDMGPHKGYTAASVPCFITGSVGVTLIICRLTVQIHTRRKSS